MANKKHQTAVTDIQKLECRISELAMCWRGRPEQRDNIKREYHAALDALYSLGTDDILDLDCELPEDDMPQEYKKRHPSTKTSHLGLFSWPSK
jgi:hypothetical protein